MKRYKRTEEYEVSLVIKDDNFINPPKVALRNAVVNRALKEFCEDLNALNEQTKNFVPGEISANDIIGLADREQAQLTDQEIMEDWQIPLMEAMVRAIKNEEAIFLKSVLVEAFLRKRFKNTQLIHTL